MVTSSGLQFQDSVSVNIELRQTYCKTLFIIQNTVTKSLGCQNMYMINLIIMYLIVAVEGGSRSRQAKLDTQPLFQTSLRWPGLSGVQPNFERGKFCTHLHGLTIKIHIAIEPPFLRKNSSQTFLAQALITHYFC